MEQQKEIDENHLAQHPSCLLISLVICYDGIYHPRLMRTKQNLIQNREKHKYNEEAYIEKHRKEDGF